MSNSKLAWTLLIGMCALFVLGLIRLYDLRLTAGDIYPPYSSYRADPLGAKVLFESLSHLPNYSVERNFRTLDDLHSNSGTLLWLGEDPFLFPLLTDADLRQFESIASRGVRLVFAMTPVKLRSDPAAMQLKNSPLEKRWGVTFAYLKTLAPRTRTQLVIKSGGVDTPVVEKTFGKGSVVLVDSVYPFSNEALATDRDTPLLDRLLGENRTVMFDERHLGLSEDASIAMLARKYRLTGLVAGLLILAVLFIWRNSTSLLPPRRRVKESSAALATGRDAASALQHLLRRNITEHDLIPACLAEWEKTRHGARSYSSEKLDILRQMATAKSKRGAVDVYRAMQSIISQRD